MSVVFLFTLHSLAVTLNEPIHFDLEIRNDSEEAIEIDLGHDRKSALSFTVETPGGRAIRLPPLSSEGLGRIGRVRLAPHSQYKQTYLLNEWYAFPAEGNYSIQPGIGAPVLSESGAVVQPDVSPMRMSLAVMPRDEQKLSAICAALLKNMRETTDREEIAGASLTMSYIQDPIAVPYIERGLNERKLMWQYAIPGLARIANEEAVDLLAAIAKRGDVESGAALAKFHLEALSTKAEPAVKERILKSLQ